MAQNCEEIDGEYLAIPATPPPCEGKIPPVKVLRPKQPGGYDCEFVEKPPSAIQTECSICLQILRVPKMIDCCGHSFCSVCIDRIEKDGKCCPLCNEKKYSLMRNKGLERSLNEFDVKCSYFKEGCCWTGKLGDLASHFNSSGSSSECGFVEEICRHDCGNYFERRSLQQHQDDECPKRPFSCDYCHDFSSTFEDVAFNHYPVCGSYPIPCPNKCDFAYAIERKDLANHVDNDCSLTLVDCDFHFAGCEVRLPRKDMPDHLKENVTHLSLMAAKLMEKDKQIATLNSEVLQRQDKFEKQLLSLKEENEHLSKQQDEQAAMNISLKQEVSMLRAECKNSHSMQSRSERTIQSMTDRLQHSVKTLQGELTGSMDAHKKELDRNSKLVDSLCSHSGLPPCSLVMTNFSKNCSNRWFSEPFYTHPKGYKMCLRVATSVVIDGILKRTHLSVYVYLMRGEFDEHLVWPFRGSVTIQLKDWIGGEGWSKVVPFSDLIPDRSAGRVTDRERSDGWGFDKFITTDQLEPRYLLNDQICFVISKVEVTHMPI